MTDTTANEASSNGTGSSGAASKGAQHPDAKEMARVVSQIPDIATGNAIVGPTEEREGRVGDSAGQRIGGVRHRLWRRVRPGPRRRRG